MKFSTFIDRNGKGVPKNEFMSLNFLARGPILVPKEAQGKKGPLSNYLFCDHSMTPRARALNEGGVGTNWRFSTNKSPYLRNGARYDKGYY